jgi:cysteine rich repeat protein
MKAPKMTKLLFVIPLVLAASAASAQQQGREACTRDASRYCRAYLDKGDQAVLACLKEHRGRLTRACQQTLASHGQ